MKAKDFILQVRADLQEKSEHWKDEELLIKLQRSYMSLQFDLPFFITKDTLAIKKDISQYQLPFKVLKNVSLYVDDKKYEYNDIENFHITLKDRQYTFDEDVLLLNNIPVKDTEAKIVYMYEKQLHTMNCEIGIPLNYHKALRLMFLSEIHEKPTRNTKDRNLNTHYLKLYALEVNKLKLGKKVRPVNITSEFQRI